MNPKFLFKASKIAAARSKEKRSGKSKSLSVQVAEEIKLGFIEYCRKIGLPVPRPEYKFHPSRDWRIDYFFLNPVNGVRVALEVEGGLFGRGKPCPVCGRRKVAGHSSIERILGDIDKYNALAGQGILLVRSLPTNLKSKETETALRKALQI